MAKRSQAIATTALLLSVAAVIGFGAAFGGQPSLGQSRTPSDGEVVAHVPARATDPATREMSVLASAIRSGNADPAVALRLARLHLNEGRRRSDPRHYGHAEAILTPLCGPSANADALVLRAIVHQARHKFAVALDDLNRALAMAPANAQAWLVKASVLAVVGKYDEALASCAEVARYSSRFVAVACRAPVEALLGRAAAASAELTFALAEAQDTSEQAWGASLLGEIALWQGDTAAAEQWLRQALSLDPEDRYSRGIYADILLDSGRAKEARELLGKPIDDEGLLIRLALAEQAVGAASIETRRSQLREKFDADRRRGEPVHGREEARFALHIEQQPERALRVALDNWALQHEPWDARLVLEAALAAKQPDAAKPVLAWLQSTGFEDRRMRGLALRVEQQR